MDTRKKKRLEARGWRFGTVSDLLNLSPQEAAYVELKHALSKNLRRKRRQQKITQVELARLLKSSQSRVAKMESGDPSVTLDLLVRSLLMLGASKRSLAHILS